MTTRRDFIQTLSGLLLPSWAVAADELKFIPLKVEQDGPKPTEKPDALDRVYTHADFRLLVQTRTWCGPCQVWHRNEKPKLAVTTVQRDFLPAEGYPRFRLQVRYPKSSSPWQNIKRGNSSSNGKRKTQWVEWAGSHPASQINAEVQRMVDSYNKTAPEANAVREGQSSSAQASAGEGSNPSGSRWTVAELRKWAEMHYTRNTSTRYWTVNPLSYVWKHLQHPKHGFSSAQVSGLSQWHALAVHSGSHRSEISPFRGTF